MEAPRNYNQDTELLGALAELAGLDPEIRAGFLRLLEKQYNILQNRGSTNKQRIAARLLTITIKENVLEALQMFRDAKKRMRSRLGRPGSEVGEERGAVKEKIIEALRKMPDPEPPPEDRPSDRDRIIDALRRLK
ncbi:MAG: hypothetical protein ABH856_03130 [Patescibacteria group bacterium]|nr:hypothetical protein [Patescibacteria group bacterium]